MAAKNRIFHVFFLRSTHENILNAQLKVEGWGDNEFEGESFWDLKDYSAFEGLKWDYFEGLEFEFRDLLKFLYFFKKQRTFSQNFKQIFVKFISKQS